MEPYQYTGANITVFRVIDPISEKMIAFIQYQDQQAEEGDVRYGDSTQQLDQNVCATEDEGEKIIGCHRLVHVVNTEFLILKIRRAAYWKHTLH